MTEQLEQFDTPSSSVNAVDVAFGGNLAVLMPPFAALPQEFKSHNGTPWNALFSQLFFSGGKLPPVKEGIDARAARIHLSAVMASFEPKHEHKEAACAYLMSRWYQKPTSGQK
ncbi:MAG: hypothetical protein NUW22_12440 [Acidobacteria bacterium]|nr:hypothetical protein [Acidobacteriota bacterium]